MLLILYKVVFVENEAVLLCVIMRKRAGTFAATVYCITLWYSVCRYKVHFLWCSFQTRFGNGKVAFPKSGSFKIKLFLFLWSIICYVANACIGVWKYVFTRVFIKSKNFYSCRTGVVSVALLSIVLFIVYLFLIYLSLTTLGS